MVTSIDQDAKKVAYLCKCYPDKKLHEIIGMIMMPNIAKDCALWQAERMGYVSIDAKKDKIELLAKEITPDMDDNLEAVMNRIEFGVTRQNSIEQDIDEEMFLQWLQGYMPQDTLIAINLLMEQGVISNYNILEGRGGKNVYTFYTLPKNEVNEWGRKNFPKKNGLVVRPKSKLTLE